jgi:Chaperone of endosialidase
VSGGGGKGGTSSSTVSIPPEVLARYNAVNAKAEETAKQPFTEYSKDPNAFVAPLTPTQQAGIANTNVAAGQAQPYYQQAGGLAAASAQNINPMQYNDVTMARYMSPFANQVIGGTLAPLQQQQAQDRQALTSSNIRAGAFGGDRAAISDAALRGQQEMATGNVVGGLLNPMFNQAQQQFNTQQGVNLAAGQANRQNYQTVAGLLGNLGTGAQTAALTGAQAQLSAGQQQQQTKQAGLTALYNQFLQQQSYPFQVTQFLANIAEGTGALSGSTTTGQQSGGFFSDERVKEDIEQIGETFDGQKIIKFRYKGEKGPKQIGLSAQDVEKHHPHAVGDYHGIKTVNYDEATKDSAHRGHFYSGGLASMGGAALDTGTRENFDIGGMPDPSLGYGRPIINPYGGLGGAPQAAVPTSRNIMTGNMPAPRGLMQANLPPRQQSGLSQAASFGKDLSGALGSRGTKGSSGQYAGGSGLLGAGQGIKDWLSEDPKKTDVTDPNETKEKWRGGRMGYAIEGEVEDPPQLPETPKPTDQFKPEQDDPLAHQKKGLTIPDDNPQAKLNPAQLPSGGGGGLGSILGGAGSFLSGAAKIAPFFLASGGLAGEREHHAGNKGDGSGSVGDNTPQPQAYNVPADPVAALHDLNDQSNLPAGYLPRTAQIESGMGKKIYNPSSEAMGWFQHIPLTAKARGIDPLDFQQSSTDAAKMAQENRNILRQQAGIDDPTGAHLYLAHQQGPGGAVALLKNSDQPAADVLTQIYQKNYKDPEKARKVAMSAIINNGGKADMTAGDFAAQIMGTYTGTKMPTTAAAGVSGGKKPLAALDTGALGYIQKLPGIGALAKSEDQGGLSEQTKVALLGGLGGMLASPNRTLLGALGSGITSGVETYQGMGGLGVQQQQANTQAQVGTANIARINAMIASGAIQKIGDLYYVVLKDGRKVEADKFFAMPENERPATIGETGENTRTAVGTETQAPKINQMKPEEIQPITDHYDTQSQANAKTDMSTRFGFGAAKADADKAGSAYKQNVDRQAEAIRSGAINTRELASQLLAASTESGIAVPGSGMAFRNAISKFGNTLAQAVGAKDSDGKPLNFGSGDATTDIVNKINILKSRGVGPEGIQMLETMNRANPNTDMTPHAFLPILMDMMVQERRALDQYAHANRYAQDSNNNLKHVQQDFERANANRYVKEAQVLKNLVDNPEKPENNIAGRKALLKMIQQHPEVTPEMIDKHLSVNGAKKMSRYFFGGQ